MLNKSQLFDFSRNIFSLINSNKFHAFSFLRWFFELTHRCNLKCPYCYLEGKTIKDEMTTKDWLNVIKQIPFYSIITLVGGEVLIRDDFIEILNSASKKTLNKVHLVTNGVLLDDKIINALIKAKLLLLSVSLDGWMENHNKYRGAKVFDKIISNLDNFSNKNKKAKINVDIKTIVLKDNLEDILKLYEYSSNRGFDFFSISFLRNNNLKQNPNLKNDFEDVFYIKKYPIELYFDIDKFEEIYLEIQKIKKYSKTKIRFSPKFDNINPKIELDLIKKFFLEYKNFDVNKIYKPCFYPYSNAIINPRGDLYPCLAYKMGNVKENKIIDIINNKKYSLFRDNIKKQHVFSSCQMCCELKVKEKI